VRKTNIVNSIKQLKAVTGPETITTKFKNNEANTSPSQKRLCPAIKTMLNSSLTTTLFLLKITLKTSLWVLGSIYGIVMLRLLFDYIAVLTIIFVTALVAGNEFRKNKWQLRGYLAPIILKNGNLSKQLIVKCKTQGAARKFIKTPPEITVSGLGGLAWLASKGEKRATHKFYEILLLSNFSEIVELVQFNDTFKNELISETIELTSLNKMVKL